MVAPSPANQPDPDSNIVARLTALPDNVRGALWILAAAFLFTLVAATIKAIGQRIPLSELLLVRQSVMLLAAMPIIVRGLPRSIATKQFGFHFIRIVSAIVAMSCGFVALRNMPIADATALTFAKSFFVTIFAILFLGEVVGLRRWSATIIGFVGVLVMLQPGAGEFNIYAILAIISAAAAGIVMITIRYLSRKDPPITILTYQTIFVGLAVAPLAIYQWVTPTPVEWALLVATGLFSVVGQSCNIRAFRVGEAGFLASLDYTRLLWAALIGILLFNEFPAVSTLVGAGIVIAAAIYTVHREAVLGSKLTRSSRGRDLSN